MIRPPPYRIVAREGEQQTFLIPTANGTTTPCDLATLFKIFSMHLMVAVGRFFTGTCGGHPLRRRRAYAKTTTRWAERFPSSTTTASNNQAPLVSSASIPVLNTAQEAGNFPLQRCGKPLYRRSSPASKSTPLLTSYPLVMFHRVLSFGFVLDIPRSSATELSYQITICRPKLGATSWFRLWRNFRSCGSDHQRTRVALLGKVAEILC